MPQPWYKFHLIFVRETTLGCGIEAALSQKLDMVNVFMLTDHLLLSEMRQI